MKVRRVGGPGITVPRKPLQPYGLERDWSLSHLGGDEWMISLKTPIPQTAALVTTVYSFPLYWTLLELRVIHVDATGVLNVTAMLVQVHVADLSGYAVQIYGEAALAVSTDVKSYLAEGGRALPPGPVTVYTNATNGHFVCLTFRVRVNKN